MNPKQFHRLRLPELFDPFGRAGKVQTRELVAWLRKTGQTQPQGVPVRDLALRDALEGMLERYMGHWMREAKRVKLFANVPTSIYLEPYIGWPHWAQTVEFGLRGSNDAGRAYLVAVKLQKAGLLERLRRCVHCGQWLFAYHPSRDRFCSDACREQSHREDRKTSKGRAKRAAYMRDYRKTTQRMAGVRVRLGQKHGLPVSKKMPRRRVVSEVSSRKQVSLLKNQVNGKS